MNFFKKGKQYEDLIRYVYEQLSWMNNKNIKVERNVIITGKSGVKHQIDVYYQFELNNITHKVIIECKNHKGKVNKGMVQSFKSVINDIGNCTGIFASRNGFQSGAIDFAKFNDIELVSGSEYPLLAKVLSKKIAVLLPSEEVIGQPFWTIMETNDEGVTGTYITIDKNTLGLFLSKKTANEVAEITGGVVRGVCQKHLRIICEFADRFNLKLSVVWLGTELVVEMPTDDIRTYYIAN